MNTNLYMPMNVGLFNYCEEDKFKWPARAKNRILQNYDRQAGSKNIMVNRENRHAWISISRRVP
jgi:hypothetical protein